MGGKTTTSTNQVTIPQEVLDRYNAVNAQASQAAQNPFQKYGTTAEDFVAQFNNQQMKGVSGINKVVGDYKPYMSKATSATQAGMGPAYKGIDDYMSPYIKDVADTTRAQMEQAQEQAQSGALGTAVQSGAFGGDRAGVAAANLANQNQMAMGSTMANIYNQGYTQALGASQADLARQLQGGAQMAGLGAQSQQLGLQGAQAQLAAGTQMQQTEQAGLDALINQFQQEQGYPFQVAQFLANIAMGTGALSGSTTTTTQPGQALSDRRLKHDIKKIGEADNGLPIYTFKYKGDEHHQTHVGFMADEVEKKNPDAVGLDPSGYKTVDYDKAAQSMGGGVHSHNKGEAFADGGVAGPYGSKVGQGVGVGSYVPQAYLPVGELMVADPEAATAHQTNVLDALNSAASAGKSVVEIRDLLNKNARGGVVGYAGGGGVEPKLHGDYLSSTLAAQEAGKDKNELMTAKPAEKQESALGNIASTLGSIASIAKIIPFSDRRLKHDIKRIGKTEKGLPIYTFKYKGDDREQTHVGFMADEVERNHPEAVGKRDGYKTVDYSQAHKFADGGVAAGRHGYALDGAVEDRIRDAMRKAEGVDAGMRLTRDEVPAVQTLGSLPDARVTPAEGGVGSAVNSYLDFVENKIMPRMDDALGVLLPVTRPLLRNEIPAGQTLGSLPDAKVVAAEAATGVAPVVEPRPTEGGVAAGVPVGAYEEMASTMREAGIANLAGDKLVPTGVAPADGQMRPKPRPEGLGAADVSSPVIVGTTMTPAEGSSEFNLDRLAAAIRFQESGSPSGNYGAIGQPVSRANGTEDRAYGAYQIMGANIPSWTKEVLGHSMTPEEFLADPQAQETVAMAKLGEYYRKFGSAEDVASAWFSGRPLEGNNSYDATSKKSVPSYVSEVMAKYYGGGEGTPANYDIGTSPSGVTGISGGLGADTAGAPSGGLKPYEDRNALGKILYDEDGKLNKNAMLSLFAGLGDMLSSPSPFLLPAIGAGISGAAKTYMAREEQLGDITSKNLENANTFMRQYLRAQAMGYAGTPEEYAASIKYTGPMPSEVGLTPATGGETNINSFMGVPFDPFGVNLTAKTEIIVDGKPVEVMAGQTYGFLDAYRKKLISDVELGITSSAEILQRVEADLANHTGQIVLADGTTVTDPTYEDAVFGSSATVRDVKRTDELGLSIPDTMRSAQEGSRRAKELYEALAMLPSTGDLAPTFAFIGRVGQQLGFDVPTNAAQGYDIASKVIAEEARGAVNELAGSVDTSMLNGIIERSTANPNMEPGAIEELLAIKTGISDYNLALSSAIYEAQINNPNSNLAEVERNFIRNNKPEDFIDKRRPEFVGKINRPAQAAVTELDAAKQELLKRGFTIGPNGEYIPPVQPQ